MTNNSHSAISSTSDDLSSFHKLQRHNTLTQKFLLGAKVLQQFCLGIYLGKKDELNLNMLYYTEKRKVFKMFFVFLIILRLHYRSESDLRSCDVT